jgi:hypothetical protein
MILVGRHIMHKLASRLLDQPPIGRYWRESVICIDSWVRCQYVLCELTRESCVSSAWAAERFLIALNWSHCISYMAKNGRLRIMKWECSTINILGLFKVYSWSEENHEYCIKLFREGTETAPLQETPGILTAQARKWVPLWWMRLWKVL